jgi:transposase
VRVQSVVRVGPGRVVHLVTDDPTAAACPVCGVLSTSVRQRRATRPRDIAYGLEPLAAQWHKVQFAGQEKACPRVAFTEAIAQVPARARITGRARQAAGRAVAAGASVLAAAGAHGLSWPTAGGAFTAHADRLLAPPGPVRVLGIDETRRGRPKWTQDPDPGRWERSERFETNVVDLAGRQGLLGQTAGRTRKAVIGWLDEQGQDWKDHVHVVATDPCAAYRAAVREAPPNATIVADHFHLVPLANQVVTEVRQRVVRVTHGRRRRASDPVWASRRRLLRGREHLSERAMTKLWAGLLDGDPTGDILTAWIAKEEPRALLATAKRGGVRSDIAHRLERFYAWCAGPAAHIPEVVRLAATVTAWWPEILAFLTTNITNAGTEGTNHLIKDAARVAFGFRRLDNQRRPVRWACTHRQRLAVVTG